MSVGESQPAQRGTAPEPSWQHFNHAARLALHTLQGSLRLASQEANAGQLEQLRLAERCSAKLLQLLQDYGNAVRQCPSRPAAPEGDLAATACAPDPGAQPDAAPDVRTLVLPRIPASELSKFGHLLQNGQLLLVEEWASDLAEVYPECEQASSVVGYLASAADLPRLQRVLERWQAGLGDSASGSA